MIKSKKIGKSGRLIRHLNKSYQLHRIDGPAWEDASGQKEWYRHGELVREDWVVEGKNFTA